MYKSGEIYKVMEQFESICNERTDREKDKEGWKKGRWYEDGNTNRMFDMYFKGYSAGKLEERLINGERIVELETVIHETLEENSHLADGDVCTLIKLKRAIGFV